MTKQDKPAKRPSEIDRRWLTIPMTRAMLEAVKRKAARRGMNQTNFARGVILGETDYNSDEDEDLSTLIRSRAT